MLYSPGLRGSFSLCGIVDERNLDSCYDLHVGFTTFLGLDIEDSIINGSFCLKDTPFMWELCLLFSTMSIVHDKQF